MDDYNRRQFIQTSIPGFLGLSLALPAITAFATRANACDGRIPSNKKINWDAFLTKLEKEAGKQHLDSWNENTYVQRAASLMHRLNLKDPALTKAFQQIKKGLGNKRVDFLDLEKQRTFEVCLLQFEKGEQIGHHDHPSMTGVLLCATGETDVWNYDLLGQRKGSNNVLLKQTSHAQLTKGNVSTLTSKQRNIHHLKAKSLTQLVDIFAPPYNRERSRNSSWFDVDTEPFQGYANIYEATKR